jgi:protein N-lysine methyltransferase METTL21D
LVEQHNLSRSSGSCCCCMVEGKTVLELGAGLGVPGMTAHFLGAAITVLTDGDTDTLANLRDNVARNIASETATICCNSITCQQLVWGDEAHIQAVRESLQHQQQVLATAGGDTSMTTMTTDQFQVILGSDIIYVDHVVEPLFDTVKDLLSTNGVFLLAFARRNVKIDLVLDAAKQRGFVWDAPATPEGVYIFSCPVGEETNHHHGNKSSE